MSIHLNVSDIPYKWSPKRRSRASHRPRFLEHRLLTPHYHTAVYGLVRGDIDLSCSFSASVWLSDCQTWFSNILDVHVCLPQHKQERVVVNPDLFRRSRQPIHFPLWRFEAIIRKSQSGSFTCGRWNAKPAVGNESACHFSLLTIPATLVVMVRGDQLVQFRVSVLVRNATCDPSLNPLHHQLSLIFACNWSTFYPQYDVIVRCSVGLILEVVSYWTEYLPFQNDSLKEIIKFLWEYLWHWDRVFRAMLACWVAVHYIVDFPEVVRVNDHLLNYQTNEFLDSYNFETERDIFLIYVAGFRATTFWLVLN